MIKVLVISIATPILIGVYKNNNLIETISKDGKTSDLLPLIFEDLLKRYEINELAYVNTPGSYMAIKVSYVFLKTISISENIKLFACNGFLFNGNSPIKALGKKYFIKEDDKIKVDFIEKDCIIRDFTLPKSLENIKFEIETLPIYNLPAV